MEDTHHLKERLNRYKAYLSNRLLFAPVSVLVGRCRLDVFFVVFAVFQIVYIHYFRTNCFATLSG